MAAVNNLRFSFSTAEIDRVSSAVNHLSFILPDLVQ